jgi:potassium voltage-gated channel Shaker-related subfamily A protein 2
MTTVGYGDKLPFTVWGKVFACISALMGTTTISL